MKFNKKRSKSPSEQKYNLASNRVNMIKNSEPASFRATLVKFKQAKQLSHLREQCQSSRNELQSKIQQSPDLVNFRKGFINRDIHFLTRNQVSGIKRQTQAHKQIFKGFIQRIKKYNEEKLINQICLKSETIQNDHKKEPQGEDVKLISKHCKTAQDNSFKFPLKIVSMEENSKSSLQNNYFQDRKKLIIQEGDSRSFFDRDYGRSKTWQQIKTKIGDQKRHAFMEGIFRKEQNEHRNKEEHKLNLFYVQKNNDNRKPLNYVSIKLMERQKTIQIFGASKQCLNNNFSLASSITNDRAERKDMEKYSKFQRNKAGKLRIRLGSQIYKKNLSGLEHNFCNSKQRFFNRQLQTISFEDLTYLQNNKMSQRAGLNSMLFQNKILQSQQTFIQKRRLLPTAGQSRQDLIRMKKGYFTIQNQSKSNKKHQNNASIPESNKVQRINGWQVSNDDGPTNTKIQQFF